MTHVTARMVAPLASFRADGLADVGGKAANLGELLGLGLPVPPGFVVTTDAYASVAAGVGLDAHLATAEAPLDPAALRAALESVSVPEELRAAIVDAYTALGNDVPVAVRSSATAEDLPGAAFAGQQDTYLNVIGAAEVVDAVRRCWASLWTDRAVDYRRERAIDPSDVRIAVIVQTMVDSDAAGVMFTADPVTGARDRITVDAGAGLGEAVVSGLVTPDHYVLDRDGRTLEHTPGRGEVVLRAKADGGIDRQTPDGRGDEGGPRGRLLTDSRLSELAGYARTIEEHFGRPQDIEWSVHEGRVFLVQSRPMTALPPPSVPLNPRRRLMGSILTEYFPSRPYPMDVSTWSANRGPTTMMRDIARHFGIQGAFEDFLREEDGVVVELVPPNPRPSPRALLTPFRLAHAMRTMDIKTWDRDPRFTDFLRRADALHDQDPADLSWPDLLEVPELSMDLLEPCRDLRQDYLPSAGASLVRLVVLLGLLRRRRLLTDLTGGAHTRTEEANRALQELADTVRGSSVLREAFDATPEDVRAALLGGEGELAAFADDLADFQHRYGRRETATPLMVSPPTLAESPESVIGLVQVLMDRPHEKEDAESRSERALTELLRHPLLRGRRARARVTRWVQAAQQGVAFREDTHFFFTALLPAMRRALLEMGARLRDTGVLTEPFDIFHLRWEEVRAIDDVTKIPDERAEHLRSLVRARSVKRAELTGVRLIDPARVFPRSTTGDALVTGTPAGSGTATGAVRIIRDSSDFHRLGSGEVLVCPYTNPSWTPLFQRAAAVVVDTGAVASHAAIVAREYGIPAVMGTGTGTSVLTDGARVTVDGGLGRVTPAPQCS